MPPEPLEPTRARRFQEVLCDRLAEASRLAGPGESTGLKLDSPLLRSWLVLLTFRDIAVGAQNIFTPAFLMMGGTREYAAWFMPQMLYEEAFGRFRVGVASAVMVTGLSPRGSG